jgi:hypothetical protein
VRWPEGREWGSAAAAPGTTVVRVTAGGPLLVTGPVRVERENGEVVLEGNAVSLCRCGGTANPPFCDGSHERNGFEKA